MNEDEHYILRDHLGSVNMIVATNGTVVQAQSFDAWGQRRHDVNWLSLTSIQLTGLDTTFTRRGFTGHEGIDALGLIHMNGRVYDPRIGRFISADPMIDGVTDTQGFNRYSYVGNNPLSYTDPTGHFKIREIIGTIVGVIAGVIATAICGPCSAPVWAWIGALSGAVQSAANGGSLRGVVTSAIIGAVSGAIFGAIGEHFATLNYAVKGGGFLGSGLTAADFASKIAAHSLAGGVMGALQGGRFGSSFFAAGLSQALSPAVGRISGRSFSATLARVAASATIGGTASVVAGGKFANGAATAAFARVVNDEAHSSDGEWKWIPVSGEQTGDILRQEVNEQVSMGLDITDLDGASKLAKMAAFRTMQSAIEGAQEIVESSIVDQFFGARAELITHRKFVVTYELRVLEEQVLLDSSPGAGAMDVVQRSGNFRFTRVGEHRVETPLPDISRTTICTFGECSSLELYDRQ